MNFVDNCFQVSNDEVYLNIALQIKYLQGKRLFKNLHIFYVSFV